MMRGGAFKPRTSPYAFQGLGEEGLKMLAAARDETGLPIVTEVMDPRDLDVVCAYADVLQIGARNMQNFLLLAEVGKAASRCCSSAGPSATIEELLMAAEYIIKEGNRQVILCERGIRTFETATRNTLDVSAVPVIKLASHLPIIVDPSHSAGLRDLVLPLSLAGVAAGADGVHRRGAPQPGARPVRRPAVAAHGGVRRVRRPRARAGALDGQDRSPEAVTRTRQAAPSPSSASASWAARSVSPRASAPGSREVRGFSQTRATLDLALERGAITRACGSLRRGGRRGRPGLRLHARAPRRRARQGRPGARLRRTP